jgi:hypothetical protein
MVDALLAAPGATYLLYALPEKVVLMILAIASSSEYKRSRSILRPYFAATRIVHRPEACSLQLNFLFWSLQGDGA